MSEHLCEGWKVWLGLNIITYICLTVTPWHWIWKLIFIKCYNIYKSKIQWIKLNSRDRNLRWKQKMKMAKMIHGKIFLIIHLRDRLLSWNIGYSVGVRTCSRHFTCLQNTDTLLSVISHRVNHMSHERVLAPLSESREN